MIGYVRGSIAHRDGSGVTIDVGGVGLKILTPGSTLSRLGAPGEPATLQTHLYVREDQLTLYGFATDEERRLFEMLLTVSGIGPKGALGMLSALSVEQLRGAIVNGNVDLLTVVPGIGKRIAARVVLDLREKLGGKSAPIITPTGGEPSVDAEVLDALVQVFGYSHQAASQAIARLGDDAPKEIDERIRAALRSIAAR